MGKHTPGPWTWDEGRPEHYDLTWLCGANGKRILTMYGGPFVHGHAAKPKQADRNLLAAAPELLAACRALLGEVEGDLAAGLGITEDDLRAATVGNVDMAADLRIPWAKDPLGQIVIAARAAIAKAEGV